MMAAVTGLARTPPALSKTRFLSGLQCPKRLYLECYWPQAAEPPDARTVTVLDSGRRVGEVARGRFPGGVLVAEGHREHEAAVRRTAELIADPSVPAIYEAGFLHEDVRVRADVLVRVPGGFDLVEVKSTTGVRAEHLWDLAVQLHVLEAAGLAVRGAFLMHLDRSYVHPGGAWDLGRLFALADRTGEVRERLTDVRRVLAELRSVLRGMDPPATAVGRHCEEPHLCPFAEHCHAGLPPDPFAGVPRVSERQRERFVEAGFAAAADVPPDFEGLSMLQRRAIEASRSGRRFVDPALAPLIGGLGRPVHFLDFETYAPALPQFPGTRPYEAIPFQWSDHRLDEDGTIEHREFLHDGSGDPRRAFAESLLEAVRGAGRIVVYSGYESARLGELQAWLPDLSGPLGSVRERLFDLLPVVRHHLYDAAFDGSFSIKAVLPAIVPGLGYDDLDIRDGGLASLAYLESEADGTPTERRAEVRRQLLAYCERDTRALVELVRALA